MAHGPDGRILTNGLLTTFYFSLRLIKNSVDLVIGKDERKRHRVVIDLLRGMGRGRDSPQ